MSKNNMEEIDSKTTQEDIDLGISIWGTIVNSITGIGITGHELILLSSFRTIHIRMNVARRLGLWDEYEILKKEEGDNITKLLEYK